MDSLKWETSEDRKELKADLFMGVCGITYKYLAGRKSMVTSTVALSGNGMTWFQKRPDSLYSFQKKADVRQFTYSVSASTSLTHKFSPDHTLRAGITYNQLFYKMDIDHAETYQDTLTRVIHDAGTGALIQLFCQTMLNPVAKLTINSGITSQYFTISGHFTIEPRIGLRWNFLPRHSIGIAYGLHAQLELLSIYLTGIEKQEETITPNRNLDFSKSHHLVLAYDFRISDHFRFRVEPFFKYLLGVNGKFTIMGGEWHDPLLWDESLQTGSIIYDPAHAFEEQEPMAKVLNLNVSCRFNRPKTAHIPGISVINALAQTEFDGYHYNINTGEITARQDALVIPNICYRIEF
jgi:hypothetical protein